MFTRQCGDTTTHHPHEYEKWWKKSDLPHLLNPTQYPEEWKVFYKCPGVIVEAWEVHYLHVECPQCQGCAEEAMAIAKEKQTILEEWREINPEGIINHWAKVTRV